MTAVSTSVTVLPKAGSHASQRRPAQIDELLERARSTDAAQADEPELDIPAEIERREVRLKAIAEARERLEKRQRDGDIERGRSDDDDRKPRDEDGKPKGGRYKREFGVLSPKRRRTSPTPTAAS